MHQSALWHIRLHFGTPDGTLVNQTALFIIRHKKAVYLNLIKQSALGWKAESEECYNIHQAERFASDWTGFMGHGCPTNMHATPIAPPNCNPEDCVTSPLKKCLRLTGSVVPSLLGPATKTATAITGPPANQTDWVWSEIKDLKKIFFASRIGFPLYPEIFLHCSQ